MNREIEEKKNFADATDLQPFFLFTNVISKNVMPASQQTQSMREPLSDEQLQTAREEHTDELINKNAETASDTASVSESTASSTNSSRKRDKVFISIVESDKDFIFITADRSTRSKTNKLSSMNYKKFYNLEERSKETINYLNDLYNIKHILNSHNHMQRALNALMTEKNFELRHVSESLIYKQALNSSFWSEWKKVMKHEIQCHDENGTWKLKRLLNERFVIIGRWIFKIKYNVDDQILRFKARWVIHDYKQKYDVHYYETWTKVIKSAFFRTFFIIAAVRRLHAEQMNIIIVFLYELLDEIIYVTQSNKFIEDFELICRLIKTLYELKQSFRMWYEVIKNFFKSLNFELINFDNNVFVNKNKKIYIAVYVNDFLIVDKNMNYINEIKSKLSDRFKMHDLKSVQHYLSIEIVRDGDSILLRQINYLKKMLERFGMKNCKSVDSSMKSDLTAVMMLFNDKHQVHANIIYWYKSIVDSLMYATTMTRSDLINALSIINRYLINSDSTYVAALQRIFRYVQKTFNYELEYEPFNEKLSYFNMFDFYDYSDADWIDTKNDRFSTSDHIFFVVEKSISWNFKRQDHIVMFSCESEYYALTEVEKKVVWLRELLLKLNQIDNASTLI